MQDLKNFKPITSHMSVPAAVQCIEKMGKISLPFVWGLRVHESCPLLWLQKIGLERVDSKLATV